MHCLCYYDIEEITKENLWLFLQKWIYNPQRSFYHCGPKMNILLYYICRAYGNSGSSYIVAITLYWICRARLFFQVLSFCYLIVHRKRIRDQDMLVLIVAALMISKSVSTSHILWKSNEVHNYPFPHLNHVSPQIVFQL